jgi:hypothetical protein
MGKGTCPLDGDPELGAGGGCCGRMFGCTCPGGTIEPVCPAGCGRICPYAKTGSKKQIQALSILQNLKKSLLIF